VTDRAPEKWAPPEALAASCFDSVRDLVALLAPPGGAGFPAVADIDRALSPLAGVGFVAGEKLRPRRRPARRIDLDGVYEVRIASRREVPTRADNAHDLLNALAWAAFPASKWALTCRLAEAQRARLAERPWRMPGSRTRGHDRLALLDEGGILIACGAAAPSPTSEAALAAALAAGQTRALVFGHALLEHALAGRLDVWGAALCFRVDEPAASIAALRAGLDAALAAALADDAFLDDPEPWPRLSLHHLARG
jgi:Protein of unknown function (DUF3025)